MSRIPVPKKTLVKSTTMLSINERFTQLRGIAGQASIRQARNNTNRQNNAVLQQASIKNRRLAQQMERRPTVMAALKIKKKSIRQRLGPFDSGISVQDRLLLPGRGVGRGNRGSIRRRGRGRGLTTGRSPLLGHTSVLATPRGIRRRGFIQTSPRGNRRGSVIRRQQAVVLRRAGHNLEPSQPRGRVANDGIRISRQIVNQQLVSGPRGSRQFRRGVRGNQLQRNQLRGGQQRGRGMRRADMHTNPLRFNQTRGNTLRRNQLRGSGGFQESRVRRGQIQQSRGQLRRNPSGRGYEPRGYEPRGRMRGGQQRQHYRGNQDRNQRESYRGFRRNRFDPKPSKEELDNELDQYMSNTQSRLDHQLDSYMRHDSSSSWH